MYCILNLNTGILIDAPTRGLRRIKLPFVVLGIATYKSSGFCLRKSRLHQSSKYWNSSYSIPKILSGFPRNVAVSVHIKMCRVNQIFVSYRIVPQQQCLPAYKRTEFFIFSRTHNLIAQGFWHSINTFAVPSFLMLIRMFMVSVNIDWW